MIDLTQDDLERAFGRLYLERLALEKALRLAGEELQKTASSEQPGDDQEQQAARPEA